MQKCKIMAKTEHKLFFGKMLQYSTTVGRTLQNGNFFCKTNPILRQAQDKFLEKSRGCKLIYNKDIREKTNLSAVCVADWTPGENKPNQSQSKLGYN